MKFGEAPLISVIPIPLQKRIRLHLKVRMLKLHQTCKELVNWNKILNARNLEQQLNEGNAVRAAQDEKISKLEGSTNKLQKECDQLTNQIEEIETKAAGLEVV